MLKSIRFLPLSLLLGSSLALNSVALADEDPDYDRVGFYIGAGVQGVNFQTADDEYNRQMRRLGLVIRDPNSGRIVREEEVEADFSPGFEVYVGYRAHRFVAVELEFDFLPEFQFDVDTSTLIEARTYTTTANVRGILPLGRLEPYLTAGIGVMHAELDDSRSRGVIKRGGTDYVGRFGGGVDTYLARFLVLRLSLDYTLARGDLHELDYLTLGAGLQFRF